MFMWVLFGLLVVWGCFTLWQIRKKHNRRMTQADIDIADKALRKAVHHEYDL